MLKQRVITAAILVPLLLIVIYIGGWLFTGVVALLAVLGLYEFFQMSKTMPDRIRSRMLMGGTLYILIGFASFAALNLAYPNWLAMLALLLTIWITDSGAYLIGRRWGRNKLAPAISPNKTVEGALGGLLCAMIISGMYMAIFMHINFLWALLITAVISMIGQIGDLIESKIKRMAQVKDSGAIFPGHGGVLDRFDSILLSAPIMLIIILIVC